LKVNEVPQDNDPTYNGQRRLCYAVNDQGRIGPAHSSGWQVETTVKSLAWQAIQSDIQFTLQRVRVQEASPLEYFMKLRMMDSKLLAQNMNLWRWRVWWHLRPRVFRRLSIHWLERYARVLNIELVDFKKIGDEVGCK
jgi:hypothetical protein